MIIINIVYIVLNLTLLQMPQVHTYPHTLCVFISISLSLSLFSYPLALPRTASLFFLSSPLPYMQTIALPHLFHICIWCVCVRVYTEWNFEVKAKSSSIHLISMVYHYYYYNKIISIITIIITIFQFI